LLSAIWNFFGLNALLAGFAIFVPLEHLLALKTGQRILRRGFAADLVYALLNAAVVKALLIAVLAVAMTASEAMIPAGLSAGVANQPVWLQVIECIIIGDVGVYATHRAFHAIPALWKFHAIHHHVEEMDWLASVHVHPIDQILTKVASLAPIVLLGFSTEALVGYFAVYFVHASLLHANVRISFGPFKWLIASPQFHHWHHANERSAYDKNFASQLAVLDLLFGTIHLPGNAMPSKYGADDPIPDGYLGQVAYPFIPLQPQAKKPEGGV
jgi:sterol desaturase/sphingolipid hydroxylase (fatty acid hydroxylase superfamily)